MKPLRVLVVGCGNMGTSHALSYHASPHFEVAGVVSRGKKSRTALAARLGGCPEFADYREAILAVRPDAVCVATYPETHAEIARISLERGCHVFVEKPIATNMKDAEAVVSVAKKKGLALVVGYILQQHPAWNLFVLRARQLGKPLVMRMNLNQQSCGAEWDTHKKIMGSLSPIADCGVHYIDVMCRMTQSKPVRVHAIGALLTNELPADRINYGHLHVVFEDGSVGWYEAGWGPMMSETAAFVKDVVGPLGSATIIGNKEASTADIDAHSKTNSIRLHFSELGADRRFAKNDEILNTTCEPDHQRLCDLEQEFLLRAIRGESDLAEHLESALGSLRVVLAAERSFREGRSIELT
ncbi:MAG: Gfo/Idh/MocA family protein [Terrimicrobiaceae bacterium]